MDSRDRHQNSQLQKTPCPLRLGEKWTAQGVFSIYWLL